MPVDPAIQAIMDGPLLSPLGRGVPRTAGGKKYQERGYFASPGTGPAGETCKTCKHLARISHARTYLKCDRRRATWTGSYGTDVRAGSPACVGWESITGLSLDRENAV